MASKKPVHPSETRNFQPPTQNLGQSESTLLQDYVLQENLAKIVREHIPGRVIYAKAGGCYGKFLVTHDISQYTRAKLFSKIGNSCKVFARFSTMGGENGSADTERDSRGFALKFYTEEGNWDLVGSNSPVFFIKDARKFPDFIQTQKRDPKTNLKNSTAKWDFWSLNPESLHQVLILMSDRGTPFGYRHMHGFAAHTYSMINDENERVWVKFHFKTQQGIRNFSQVEHENFRRDHPDFAQEDLVIAIEKGDFPKWTVYMQVMTEEQAADFRWNPFDVTKVWFHHDFPLIEVGELELNQLPENYHVHVEQAVFSPGNLIPGIGLSPDKMLQARLISYADAQRYRIGANADQIEVNRTHTDQNTYQNDASFLAAEDSREPDAATHFSRHENDDDHYTQPGLFYTKALNNAAKQHLISNIVSSMKEISGPRKNDIINRQLCHFFRANIELGMKIAYGLQINIDDNLTKHFTPHSF